MTHSYTLLVKALLLGIFLFFAGLCGSAAFRAERLGLSDSGFILRGCASEVARRHSLKLNRGAGEAEPHRTEGGKAAQPSLETNSEPSLEASSEYKSERDLEDRGDSRTK